MKTLSALLILLTTQSAMAAQPINNFLCTGQKLTAQGAKSGLGELLIVVLDNGTIRITDRGTQAKTELLLEGSDNTKSALVFRTESTQAGQGLVIHNQNLNLKLGEQVYLYSLSLAKDKVAAQYTLNCKVTGSSNF